MNVPVTSRKSPESPAYTWTCCSIVGTSAPKVLHNLIWDLPKMSAFDSRGAANSWHNYNLVSVEARLGTVTGVWKEHGNATPDVRIFDFFFCSYHVVLEASCDVLWRSSGARRGRKVRALDKRICEGQLYLFFILFFLFTAFQTYTYWEDDIASSLVQYLYLSPLDSNSVEVLRSNFCQTPPPIPSETDGLKLYCTAKVEELSVCLVKSSYLRVFHWILLPDVVVVMFVCLHLNAEVDLLVTERSPPIFSCSSLEHARGVEPLCRPSFLDIHAKLLIVASLTLVGLPRTAQSDVSKELPRRTLSLPHLNLCIAWLVQTSKFCFAGTTNQVLPGLCSEIEVLGPSLMVEFQKMKVWDRDF